MTAGLSGPERELRATRPADPPRVPLRDVAERLGLPAPASDPVVTGISLGSSRVLPGDLYAALPGARAHGASYAAQAIERGAVAVLTDAEGAALLADVPVPVLVVESPRRLLGGLAADLYGRPAEALRMIAVTGTQGKTTTTRLADQAFEAAGVVAGVIGTVGTRVAGEEIKTAPDHPRGARPARPLRDDARARRQRLRDGGLQPRAGDGTRRRRRLRRRGVHQPRPRPPRLPRRRRGVLRGEGRAVHPPARPARPGQHRRRPRPAAGGGVGDRDQDVLRDRGAGGLARRRRPPGAGRLRVHRDRPGPRVGDHLGADRRRLQRRQRAGRDRGDGRGRLPARGGGRRAGGLGRRTRAAGEGRGRPGLPRGRRLRAQARRGRGRAEHVATAHQRPADRGHRRRAATGTPASGR